MVVTMEALGHGQFLNKCSSGLPFRLEQKEQILLSVLFSMPDLAAITRNKGTRNLVPSLV